MADLSVKFLGIPLKNPVIAGSSGLTSTLEGVARAVDAGAGAVVLKSLFEEQLRAELSTISGNAGAHPEAEAFLAGMGMAEGAGEYLELIRKAKESSGVPIIASVNCSGDSLWAEFASSIEAAGADAIELNIGAVPTDPSVPASAIEDRLVSLVASVAGAVGIPVCSKIGSSFTNVGNVASRLAKAGSRGLTLFNRFYRMDVDLDAMSLSAGPMRGSPEAYHESLRWISILEGRVGAELSASGGVHDGATALRLIAAGAETVQMCSAVYAKGYGAIASTIGEMRAWLDARGIASVADLRGRLSRRNSPSPELYGRLHYVKALTGQG
ncbi:MAG: dihydroorotate dehydrogenase-like protein [Spirochaetes bacterium]|nr:dihydroorotate dehydrogenase-like protein [Spirochaetota bacterium]MBU1081481.1 dihydroorotate dehydrogenase-like protein [Spirochaetota bacterium]